MLRELAEDGKIERADVIDVAHSGGIPAVEAIKRVLRARLSELREQNEDRMILSSVDIHRDARSVNGQIRECKATLAMFDEALAYIGEA
jgi:hypothetical protein